MSSYDGCQPTPPKDQSEPTYLKLGHVLEDLVGVLGTHVHVVLGLLMEPLSDTVDLFPVPLSASGGEVGPLADELLHGDFLLEIIVRHLNHGLNLLLAHIGELDAGVDISESVSVCVLRGQRVRDVHTIGWLILVNEDWISWNGKLLQRFGRCGLQNNVERSRLGGGGLGSDVRIRSSWSERDALGGGLDISGQLLALAADLAGDILRMCASCISIEFQLWILTALCVPYG